MDIIDLAEHEAVLVGVARKIAYKYGSSHRSVGAVRL